MQFNDDKPANPYAPPSASSDLYEGAPDSELQILAERGTRLGAAFLDGLLAIITMSPVFFSGAWSTRRGFDPGGHLAMFGIAAVLFLGLMSYQWYLIATLGQSLGKKWLSIKIVKLDGSPVGFVHGVLLRSWITGFLGAIPYIGGCISLVDVLMIFGNERRCLHDQIAGTKVIVAHSYG